MIPNARLFAAKISAAYCAGIENANIIYHEFVTLGGNLWDLREYLQSAPDIWRKIRDFDKLCEEALLLPYRVRMAVMEFPKPRQRILCRDGVRAWVNGVVIKITLRDLGFNDFLRQQVFGRARIRTIAQQKVWFAKNQAKITYPHIEDNPVIFRCGKYSFTTAQMGDLHKTMLGMEKKNRGKKK
jgi:hypothetical protein